MRADNRRPDAVYGDQIEVGGIVIGSHIGRYEGRGEPARAARKQPKPEKLRTLLLGASPEGDLRVAREQQRIRSAIESALHRDVIEFDVRPAATAHDLLEGVTAFRPQVIHFSGHSADATLLFEAGRDELHYGIGISLDAFAQVVEATDKRPVLVILNACRSASMLDALVDRVVPLAIGMSDAIEDGDAIVYAAQFYASVANGQSVESSHKAGRAALALAGRSATELPTLVSARGVDPGSMVLVRPSAGGPSEVL